MPSIRAVVLDTGPLGLLTHSKMSVSEPCSLWARSLLSAGLTIIVPEITDFELRRELLRLGFLRSVAELDRLGRTFEYLPISTSAMRRAAQLWALARQKGRSTADPKELDADVILAAQALDLGVPNDEFVVATGNVGHLSQFVPAEDWQNIRV